MNIKERDNYFDNIRGFLIFCVILGNSLEYIYIDAIDTHYLILLLYMFHMPMFTFISGYFCKQSKRSTTEKVINTTKIYLFAQTFYFIFNRYILGGTGKFQLFYAGWTLWYLLALIAWYIISDYIKNYKKAFIISIILALLVGFDNSIGSYASISRIFFFLPFFIAGLAFNKEKFLEKYKKYTPVAAIMSLIILIILFLFKDVILVDYLFEYSSYSFFSASRLCLFTTRVFHYIGAAVLCTFILLVFTNKKLFLAWPGKSSLILYIMHACVIQSFGKIPYDILRFNSWIQLIYSEIILLSTITLLSYIYLKIKSLFITYRKNKTYNNNNGCINL